MQKNRYPRIKFPGTGHTYELCRALSDGEKAQLFAYDYLGETWAYPIFPLRVGHLKPTSFNEAVDIYLVRWADGDDVLTYSQGHNQEFRRWD